MTNSPITLVLTLKLDQVSFDHFNQLRKQHFPAERNYLPAHVTLFHALPGEQIVTIQQILQEACAHTPVLRLNFPQLRFLGQGVAVEISCPELVDFRDRLAKQLQQWLNRQDQQRYRPHITIQNKTTAERSRQLYQHLTQNWQPLAGYGEGVLLWHYQGGPWKALSQFTFAGIPSTMP